MDRVDLSILIPARDEEFLGITIQNILSTIEGSTEVIAVLDGYRTPIPELPQDERVTIIKLGRSIGQRAATNLACRLSTARYVMKCDAHVAFDKGFDVKMMTHMQDDYTMVPVMRNLHAFDWVCPDGHRRSQDEVVICDCGKKSVKEIVWKAKSHPQSTAYRFDKNMHFHYWNEYGSSQKGDITESMSIQGSCFMLTRAKYLELDICDETYGSWGQQGVEVACKTWLSGGRVVINRTTWYAHMFRNSPSFGFPWPASGSAQEKARARSKDLWLNNKWPKAVNKFQWLIDKFSPIPGWEKVTKGIVYYTDNRLDEKIANKVRSELMKVESSTLPIVSVSLKPLEFGENYVLPLERGYLTLAKQILKGLETLKTDVVFFAEHDVLYHPSHFDFTPPAKDVYYYNTNNWFLRADDGHTLYYEHKSLSQMCCYRETAIKHFKERIRRIEELEASAKGGIVKATSGNDIPLREGIHRLGFEPGTHNRPERIDSLKAESYRSEAPNVDIKHDRNLTHNRWHIDQFRDKSVAKTWKEAEDYQVEGWGRVTI